MTTLYRHTVPLKKKKAVELTRNDIITLKESDGLCPKEQVRLNKYLAKETQQVIEKVKKDENRKITVRDQKNES